MKKIKVGVVGVGFVGPIHIENLRRLGIVEVAAVAMRNQEKANKAAERLGVAKAYGDWEKLVADEDIDVVHITAPNILHFPVAKACIEAGKHVVCEKPLTLDVKEAKILVKLAKKRKVVNATTYNMGFYPMIRQAKEIVASGGLGKIFLVHGKYLQDWLSRDSDYNWRVEAKLGGKSRVVADIGSHWMQMVQLITGKRIISVYADTTIFIPIRKKPTITIPTHSERELMPGEYKNIKVDTEDHATIMFRFEDGIKGVLIAAQVCPGRKQRIEWEINGSERSLAWCGEEPNVLWIGERSKSNGILIKDVNLMEKNARQYVHYPGGLAEGYPDSWKNIFMKIYQYIASGSLEKNIRPDFPTFEEGLELQILIDSVLESGEKNEWIDIKS